MNIKKSIHNYDTAFDTEASLDELKKLREQLDFLIKKEESQASKEETVASLRKKGWKVRVYHYREEKEIWFKVNHTAYYTKETILDPKGGRTEVSLITPNGRTSKGVAVCDKEDNYCRKEGVRIALERALKNLEEQDLKNHLDKKIDLVKKFVESQNKRKTPVNPWPIPPYYPFNPLPHYPKPFMPWNDPNYPIWTTKFWCKL
jgi:hypothetical protein